jgi:hypothetical protein
MQRLWGWFVCWLLGRHVPIEIIRSRPRRSIDICSRCGIDLSDDHWRDDGHDGPRRSV